VAEMNVSILVRLKDSISGPMRRVADTAKLATKSLEVAGKRADELFKKAGDLKLASEGIGRFGDGAMSLVREPLKLATDFEKSMRQVGARARLSGAELEGLSQEALRIGSTTKNGAGQAAEGMLLLARGGRDAKGILSSLPNVLNVAEASGLDLAQAVHLVTETQNAFRISAGESARVSDVLVTTTQRTSTTIEELAQALEAASPMANTLGVSFETTAAMAGLLANANIKGGKAGEALKAMLKGLIQPSQDAGLALRYLGISRMDPNNPKQLKQVDTLIAEITKKTAGMSKDKRGRLAAAIFGESAPAVVALMEQGSTSVADLAKELKSSEGAAKRFGAQAGGGAAGATRTFSGAVESLKISLGRALLPALTKAIDKMNPVISGLGNMAQEHPGLTAGILGSVAATAIFAKTLQALLTIMTAFKSARGFGALATGVKNFATIITSNALPAVLKFGAALLANPLVIVALAVITLGIAVAVLAKNWDKITATLGGVWERFTKASTAAKVLVGYFAAIGLIAASVFAPILLPIGVLVGMAALIVANWTPVKAFFSNLWDGITGAFKKAVDKVSEVLKPLLDNPIIKWIIESGRSIGSFVGGTFKEAAQIFTGPDEAKPVETITDVRTKKKTADEEAAKKKEEAQGGGLGALGAMKQQVEGVIKVVIDGPGRVASVRSRGGVELEVDAGLSMVTP
jgi:TP901 family phage tail tape measure protein